jgi:hypothetical protein
VLIGVLGPAGSSSPFAIPVPNQPALATLLFTLQGLSLTGTGLETSPVAIAQLGY